MKCEWVRENIVLQVYGELADDARHELEQHVARCADCAAELKAEQRVSRAAGAGPRDRAFAEPGGVLAHAVAGSAGDGQAGQLLQPAGVRSGELAAAGEILSGAGVGDSDSGICGRSWSDLQAVRIARHDRPGPTTTSQTLTPTEASIAGISSIVQDPGTNQISIKYNTVSTQEAQGSLNDEKIQQLLLYAARNNYNTGVRVDSVGLLAQKSSDQQVREALIYALQNDTNPGVRLKSLDALGNYVKNRHERSRRRAAGAGE